MKVSVLVPVYGVEKYIERCARSLFEQTYPDLEYVFVNDCTPDRSIEILKKVMEEYPERKDAVRIVNHAKNRGLAAARNTAYDNAGGSFVIMVDSDDWLELNAIELLVKKQMETGADFVFGIMRMYFSDRIDELQAPSVFDKEEYVLKRLGNGWDNILCGRLIRRAVIENNHVRAIEGCNMAEDKYQMALISYYADSFAVCEKYIHNYERRNDNSIVSYQSKDKTLKNGLQFLRNNIGLQLFFADKETVFYEEASKQTMLYANSLLKMIVRFNARQHFQFVIEIIDTTESKFWPIIGWAKEGLRGKLLHQYWFMWMKLTCERTVRFLKKKTSL